MAVSSSVRISSDKAILLNALRGACHWVCRPLRCMSGELQSLATYLDAKSVMEIRSSPRTCAPKVMTDAVILAGPVGLLLGTGVGIASPMVGRMITAPLLSMFVIPARHRVIG